MKVQLKPSICEVWEKGDTRYKMKTGIQYEMEITEPDYYGDPYIAGLENYSNGEPETAYFRLDDLIGELGEINQENYPELYL